ncbi:hypothetical protein [Comamonas sp. JC664]|uniref:hypothetical protein n=1 Tax=Comamonas sp. JC664 TaxID=2801917 RepID=UPI0017480FEC|nr:hypothetical protein [Comamonas sp. JC664]MBL0696340.1 hypothetical protein [Comamonas sp. JC664]GHG66575.1 hypothetical protein GCM10012319_08780 [Comamonas sp. KCTC 72670]
MKLTGWCLSALLAFVAQASASAAGPKPEKALVFNLTQCGGFLGEAPPSSCVEHATPAACIKGWVEAQQAHERSTSRARPAHEREGAAPAD